MRIFIYLLNGVIILPKTKSGKKIKGKETIDLSKLNGVIILPKTKSGKKIKGKETIDLSKFHSSNIKSQQGLN